MQNNPAPFHLLPLEIAIYYVPPCGVVALSGVEPASADYDPAALTC